MNIISYHTSASGKRKNIALLHPISIGYGVGYGMQTCYIFFVFHERACDNEFIFQSHLQCAKFEVSERYFTRAKFRM